MVSNEPDVPQSVNSSTNQAVWLIDKRVILVRLNGAFNREDAMAGIQRVGVMMKEGREPVHLILDMRGVSQFTTNFREIMPEIMAFRREMSRAWAVMLSDSKLIRFFGTLVANTLRGRFHAASDMEDAIALLRSVDPTVRDLPVLDTRLIDNPPAAS